MADFGFGRDRTVGGVVDDFVDRLLGASLGVGLGKVAAGDLQAVEQNSGAAGVEGAGGEVLEDEADGELDGGAVLGEREIQRCRAHPSAIHPSARGALAGGPGTRTDGAPRFIVKRRQPAGSVGIGGGAAGGVVVVAEVFVAQAGAAAAAAVGEEVAALEPGRLGGVDAHFCLSGLNAKARRVPGFSRTLLYAGIIQGLSRGYVIKWCRYRLF